MTLDLVDKIVNSVLYEGYMLYPYRRSSLKNQHRWNFGIVYPERTEPYCMTTECLIEGPSFVVRRTQANLAFLVFGLIENVTLNKGDVTDDTEEAAA